MLEDELGDKDWVLLSDCDECLDFDSERRASIVKDKIERHKKDGVIQIPRIRYWFDYDMMWPAKRSVPIVSGGYLKNSEDCIADIRSNNIGSIPKWRDEIIFEYSFCYSIRGIKDNYSQTYHTGYGSKNIHKGVECAHVPVSDIRGTSLSSRPEVWLERVKLHPRNSPSKVRNNLGKLKTDIIPNDYADNRIREYPDMWKSMVWKLIYYSRLKYRMSIWYTEKLIDKYIL